MKIHSYVRLFIVHFYQSALMYFVNSISFSFTILRLTPLDQSYQSVALAHALLITFLNKIFSHSIVS